MTKNVLAAALALAASHAALAADPAEAVSRGEDRESVAVTIYNDDLALIRETRKVPLNEGANRIALRDVAARIMPETASLAARGEAVLQLLEQNFDYDLLSGEALLAKNVGKRVTTIRTNPANGEETREEATVLADNNGVVLQYADRIETGLPANVRLAFHDVPANLRDRPTLTVDLTSDKAGEQSVDLAYLSRGFDWQADYVASLADDENTLNLAGWVTLNNQSGTAYENATLQLVAGDVARVQEEFRNAMPDMEMAVAAPMKARPMLEEGLFEYHLYTLDRPTTLKNNQSKQVALLSAAAVPVQKEYRLQGDVNGYYNSLRDARPEDGDKRKVEVSISFKNDEANKLGLPLPKGIVRVYKNDSGQRAQFIGEDRIDHTAKNDEVRLKLGNTFDVNGVWKLLDVKRMDKGKLGKLLEDDEFEATYRIELSNAKKEAVTVKVVEPIPGDWRIIEENLPHEKVGANHAQWQVDVPADGKTELQYKVRIKI
ncbi:DUF4139 domain-containing protein [uncultured Cardiobacterium sp.]|uniref:DUF4139 domain-containing protein n=1 Tax=uncultured Cardiobacterium sp. TaxID=417619 RepID=UPI0026158753|nr:DUF4139 domain-containing protein [uncultured Cardiobacterium sp.]